MMTISENVNLIFKEIPKNINVLAATKERSLHEIEQSIKAGIKIVGENYVQEAEKKYQFLKGKVEIHCIGHLQRNKVKKAVEIFDMIQTVDSEKIAFEINRRCNEIKKSMPVLIEVNIAKEINKSGCMPEDVVKIAGEIPKLSNLRLKGIMTMGHAVDNAEKLRPYFKEAKRIFDELKKENDELSILSMGMSDSYKIAIEEGATMIRIGNRIFGIREREVL